MICLIFPRKMIALGLGASCSVSSVISLSRVGMMSPPIFICSATYLLEHRAPAVSVVIINIVVSRSLYIHLRFHGRISLIKCDDDYIA